MSRFDVIEGQNFTREELFLIELCVDYVLPSMQPAKSFRLHMPPPWDDGTDVFERVQASVLEKIATDFVD